MSSRGLSPYTQCSGAAQEKDAHVSRLLRGLLRLPFIIVVTCMSQHAARSRRPDLSGRSKASRNAARAIRRHFLIR
jgi:hypothetical protein